MSDRLDEIRARLDAATPGPWDDGPRWAHGHDVFAVSGDPPLVFVASVPKSPDADLIAHAPADIAWLLDEVERLERLAEHDRKFAPLDPCDCWRCQEADDA